MALDGSGEAILWNTIRGEIVQKSYLVPLTAAVFRAQDLIIGDFQGRIYYWRIADAINPLTLNSPHLPNWQLQWVSCDLSLDTVDMNIDHARGLNKPNYDLLRQRGVKGTPFIACRYCQEPTKEHFTCDMCGEYFCASHGIFRNPAVPSELAYSRCHLHLSS